MMTLRAAMFGPFNVGKTTICQQMHTDGIRGNITTTIGIDYYPFVLGRFKYQLWDTAGMERFDTITNSYMHGNALVMVVGSLDQPIEPVRKKLAQVCKHSSMLVVLVLNKMDLMDRRHENEVKNSPYQTRVDAFEELAKQHLVKLYQISASNRVQVSKMFEQISIDVQHAIDQATTNNQPLIGVSDTKSRHLIIDTPVESSSMCSC